MQNLTRFLEYHARLRPEALALVYRDQRINWRELDARVKATAAGLSQQGVGPDTIVAMIMKNSAAFIELLYAVSHLGGVVLPVNFRLAAEEVAYIANHAGASLIVADEEFETLTTEVNVPVILLGDGAQAASHTAFGDMRAIPSVQRRVGGDLFRLMYTSGTTDRPKGVIHTYDNFYWKCLDHLLLLELSAADRLCVVGPLYHVGACDLPGIAVHITGGAIFLLRDFDPTLVMKTIELEKISGIWMAPVMTNGILGLEDVEKYDCSSLEWCIGGGERTPESRIRQFVDVFPNARYIDAYGMTETVSGDTFMEPGYEIEKIGSVGRAVPFLELEIRDDDGNSLPPNAEGEICMRGAKVTAGYWRDPERSAQAFWPDGMFRSGDVGYLDQEGFLYITDRKKDLIISAGENISSSEVERVIYELPQILEAAVVARADERWGEIPVAAVVLREGAQLSFEQLKVHCSQHLAAFKCPKDLVLIDCLPRNPSGKVLKSTLRDLCSGR